MFKQIPFAACHSTALALSFFPTGFFLGILLRFAKKLPASRLP
jgi:hypothetical protein